MRWPLLGLAALVTLWIEFVPPAFAQATPTATLQAGTTAYGKGEFNQAYELLQPLAEAGEPEAEWYLGLMHVRGEGTPQDYTKAMHWFRRAADHSYSRAYYDVALMHELGEGRPVDHTIARQWYERGIQARCVPCMRHLGFIDLYGVGDASPAPQRALQWLREAADAGSGDAALYLGAGLLSMEDAGARSEALFHLQRAATQGHVPSRVLWNIGRWALPDNASDLAAALRELRTLANHPDLRPRTRALLWSILTRSALVGRGMAVDPSQALADAARMDAVVKQLDESSFDAFEDGLRRSFLSFRYAPYFDQVRAILDARVDAQGGNRERACEAAFDLARGVLDGWLGTSDALLALEAVERCPVDEEVMAVLDPNLLLQLLHCEASNGLAACRQEYGVDNPVRRTATQANLQRELAMLGLYCEACRDGMNWSGILVRHLNVNVNMGHGGHEKRE